MAIFSKKASELPLLMLISTIVAVAFLVVYFKGGITGAGASCTDLDADNYSIEGDICGARDCDDTNAAVNPGAAEICNDALDNDCNSLIDCNDTVCSSDPVCAVSCTDADLDGYNATGGICGPIDCDDTNPEINPSKAEICDNLDNNCDTQIDENLIENQSCGLGICANGTQTRTCTAGSWSDWSACSTAGNAVNETCNGLDDDCDGSIDEGLPSNTYYRDADSDTYGDPSNSLRACSLPSDYVNNSLDCNDTNANIYTNATEICDSLDNNCNNQTDESDIDDDGITICLDNCPSISNSNQNDADDDGIGDACDTLTGTEDDINSNVNLKVYIGSETNLTQSFTGVQTVKFKTSNGKQLVQFNFNFTNSTLDLTAVKLNINELSNRGSFLVSGLPAVNKTIWIDQISDSGKVCIKDAEVANITSLSTNCTSSTEIKLNCPGTSGNISCEISGVRYKISGLTHTAAVELAGNKTTTTTTTNATNTTIPKFVPENTTTTAQTSEGTLPAAGATVTSAPTPSKKKISGAQIAAMITAVIASLMFVGTRIARKPKQPQQKRQYQQYKYPYYYDYSTGQWRYYYPQQQYLQYPQQPQWPQQQTPQQPQWPQQYPQNNGYYWPPH